MGAFEGNQLRVFYDGGCPLCSREVEYYRKVDTAGGLELIDIDQPGFDAGAFGLDRVAVRENFHVQKNDGQVIAGLDAFICIWDRLPGFKFGVMARIARSPGIHGLLKVGYLGFAKVRPLLPRVNRGCETGVCSVLKKGETL